VERTQAAGEAGAAAPPRPGAAAPDLDRFTHWAFICESSDCRWRGSALLGDALAQEIQRRGCGSVAVVRTGCLGLCGAGPAVVTYPAGEVHLRVEPADAADLAAHLAAGTGLPRRSVRAPQWYRDQLLARLGYFVQLLKRRAAVRAP
jgi:(2Fe-2S) ferredoxin